MTGTATCVVSTASTTRGVISRSSADRVTRTRQGLLALADPQRSEVEPRGREYGVGARLHRPRKVLDGTRAARRDHRDRDFPAHEPDQLQVEPVLGAVGVHRVQQNLAGPEIGGPPGPFDGVEPGAAPAAVGGHLETALGPRCPTRVHREHEDLVPEPVRDLGDQVGTADGGGVDRYLVGPGPQQGVHLGDTADPAADSERDEHLFGGPRHDVHGGRSALVRGGDVQERQLVGPLRVVHLREPHRVARVARVLEVDPLDDPARVDVEAGDHPDGERHEPLAAERVSARASSSVNRPSYSAVPMIAPSTPSGTRSAIAERSASSVIPPEATTGLSVAAHTDFRRSRFGPWSMPSLFTSVTTYRAQPSLSRRSRTSNRSPPCSVHPRAASVRPRTSSPTATRSPWSAMAAAHQAGFSSAAAPMFPRRQPVARAAASDSSSRMPPLISTLMSSLPTMVASSSRLWPRPNAASRSTR